MESAIILIAIEKPTAIGRLFANALDPKDWVQEPMTLPPEIPILMQRIAQRDSKALRDLYGRFSQVLYNAIFSIVKGKEDAEEILGEVFFQVWEKAPTYDIAKGSVYTWLLTMSRNRAIDRIRSKGFRSSKDLDMAANVDEMVNLDHSNQLDQVVLSERASQVKSALEKIPPEQRRVLETAYFDGKTQSEIAVKLGVPLGTVKSRARDGMKALQGILKDML